MKTTLLHLEPHDDLVSIRDRMSWAKTPRILLIWPRHGRVEIRPLDLALLRRHARSLGAELGLVTRSGDIWQAARELQIPCFPSPRHAQRNAWRSPPKNEFPAPQRTGLRQLRASLPAAHIRINPAGRLPVFSAGVLAILLIVATFLPSAQIAIETPRQIQEIIIPVAANPQASQVFLSGSIPARKIFIELETSADIAASGQALQPGDKARVTALFSNLTSETIEIPAGTVILTRGSPAIAFATTFSAKIPPDGKLEILAQARQGGESGNVPAGSIAGFENPLGLKLTVTNLQAATGGSDRQIQTASDADRDRLRAQTLKTLLQEAQNKMPGQVESGDILFEETLSLDSILSEEYSPSPGAPTNRLSLRLRVRFVAYYAAQNDLQALAALTLDAALPPASTPRPESLTVSLASPLFVGQDGAARFEIRATRAIHPAIEPGRVIELTRGKTVGGAKNILLQAYDLDQPPQITISPSWWPFMPVLPFRINLTPNS
jgi:hypothetical protein